MDAGVAAHELRGPEVLGGAQRQGEHAAGAQGPGGERVELAGVEAVGLAGGGLGRTHEQQVVLLRGLDEAARVVQVQAHGPVEQRTAPVVVQGAGQQAEPRLVELDDVDPLGAVLQRLGGEPCDVAAQDQDGARRRDLQRGQVDELLGAGALALPGERVVVEDDHLAGSAGDGDPTVGGVPAGEQVGVDDGSETPVERAGAGQAGEEEGGEGERGQTQAGAPSLRSTPGGRQRRQPAAQERRGEGLHPPAQQERGQGPAQQPACALDGVGAGQRVRPAHPVPGGPLKQHAGQARDGQQRQGHGAELLGERQVGARDRAEGRARQASEDGGRRKQQGEDEQGAAHPGRGGRAGPSSRERAEAGAEEPDSEGERVDELAAEEGDVELAQQDDLAEDGDDAGGEEGDTHGGSGRQRHFQTPAMGAWQCSHRPSFRCLPATKKPLRSMTVLPQRGQVVLLPGWPGTLPTKG